MLSYRTFILFCVTTATAFLFGMSLLPLALLFVIYALVTFLWRSEKIKTRDMSRSVNRSKNENENENKS